jgi:hypothetical protein
MAAAGGAAEAEADAGAPPISGLVALEAGESACVFSGGWVEWECVSVMEWVRDAKHAGGARGAGYSLSRCAENIG